jgi:hypothetical protein
MNGFGIFIVGMTKRYAELVSTFVEHVMLADLAVIALYFE